MWTARKRSKLNDEYADNFGIGRQDLTTYPFGLHNQFSSLKWFVAQGK